MKVVVIGGVAAGPKAASRISRKGGIPLLRRVRASLLYFRRGGLPGGTALHADRSGSRQRILPQREGCSRDEPHRSHRHRPRKQNRHG